MASIFDNIARNTSAGAAIQGFGIPYLLEAFSVATSSYKSTRTKIIGGKFTLVFDSSEDFKPTFSSRLTSHPVEDGADISDHRIKENPTFSLRGIYSDYSRPLNRETFLTQAEFYQTLLKIHDDDTLISLITPLDTFTDLSLKSVSFPKKTGDGTSLYIDLEFEKLRRVSSELTTVFVSSTGKVKSGSGGISGTGGTTTQSGDTAIKTKGEVDGGRKSALTVVTEGLAEVFN